MNRGGTGGWKALETDQDLLSSGEFKRSGLDPEELDFYNHLIVFHFLSSAKIYFHGLALPEKLIFVLDCAIMG